MVTDRQRFLLSIGAGKFMIGNEVWFAISAQTPIYAALKGKTVGDVLEQMDGDWSFWSSRHEFSFRGMAFVDLKLPCFETNSQVNLKPVMSALGMPTAFTPAAEFPHFCNEKDFFIELMKQVAKIKVNEEGSEAAAITVIGTTGSGPDPIQIHYATFHATRPFLYVISEQSTGAIFFIGQYMGDGTTGISDLVRSDEKSEAGKDALYDLSGRKLECAPQKGIYIKNGQKVLVK